MGVSLGLGELVAPPPSGVGEEVVGEVSARAFTDDLHAKDVFIPRQRDFRVLDAASSAEAAGWDRRTGTWCG